MSDHNQPSGFLAMAKEMVKKQGHEDFLSDDAVAGDYEDIKKKILGIFTGEVENTFQNNIEYNFENVFYVYPSLDIDGRELITTEERFTALSEFNLRFFDQIKSKEELTIVVPKESLHPSPFFHREGRKGGIGSSSLLIEKKFFDYLLKDDQFAGFNITDKKINDRSYSLFEDIGGGKLKVDISRFNLPTLGYRQLDYFDGKIYDLEKSVPGGAEFNLAISKTRTTEQAIDLIRMFYNWLVKAGIITNEKACWLLRSGKTYSGLVVGNYNRKTED